MSEFRTMSCPVCDAPVEAEATFERVGAQVSCAACEARFLLAYDIDWDPETAAEFGFFWLRADTKA